MIGLAPSDSTTTAIYEFENVGRNQVLVHREQFSATVLVGTEWEIEPVKAVLRVGRHLSDWDGYGSPSPNELASNLAIAFLGQIAALGFENLPRPDVGAIAGGGVALEWGAFGRELNISVFNEGTAEYVRAEAAEPMMEGPIAPWMIGRLRSLFAWFQEGRRRD